MSAAEKLTLVLPLRGRPKFTRRWLAYAASVSCPFRVAILDGSSEADAEDVRRALKDPALKGLRIEYARRADDRGTLPDFYAKLAAAARMAKTPYLAMAANDDFPVVDGLARCVERLEASPDHASCGGAVASVAVAPDERFPEWRAVYSRYASFEAGAPAAPREEETSAARLDAHFRGYDVTWYDVHRAAPHQRRYEALEKAGFRDIFLSEMLMSFLTVAEGKTGKLPPLAAVRQTGDTGSGSAEAAEAAGFVDLMLVPTWSEDFGRFVAPVAAAMAERDGLAVEKADALVRRGYKHYAEATLKRTFGAGGGAAGFLGRLKKSVKSRLPKETVASLKDALARGRASAAKPLGPSDPALAGIAAVIAGGPGGIDHA